MRSLPLFHRVAGQPVIVLGSGPLAEAKRRLVTRAGGVPVGEDDAEARLAFVVLDAPEDTAARLKARGLLVNVTDRADLCDFTVPALVDRDPVLIAVGTDGASAGLAKHLRLRLEALLPAGLGALGSALEGAKAAIRARWGDMDDRRRVIDAALVEGGPLDPLADLPPDAVERWLAGADDPTASQTIVLSVASDDPDDLTLRQARLLGMADAILYDASLAPEVLARSRADAQRIPLPADPDDFAGLVLVLHRA